jgi:biopolymer transport protein ExbD
MSNESNGGIQLIEEEETPLNSSINTTPLVDIMLVMLIIFLITVPVVVGTVEVELPEERNQAVITKPENVNLSVDTQGNVYWNQYRLPDEEELMSRLRQAAVIVPQPEVHIRGDQETEYHNVGRVVEAAQKAGIAKIGFITKKPGGGGY